MTRRGPDDDAARRPRGFPLRLERLARIPAGAGGAAGLAAPAAVPAAPAGAGLDSAVVRRRMVERLRAQGIGDARVLAALEQVPRHRFVDGALVAVAYEDTALPIGLAQTISKPSVVARMLEILFERPGVEHLGRVLEIGTGCGYQAAVLGELARQVFSVERLRALHERARANLAEVRRDNLRLVHGDGMLGHPPNAPYDAIISSAGGRDVPAAWIEQLAPGGRLVAPTQQADGSQALLVIDKAADGRVSRRLREAVFFVPLESGLG